MSNSINNKLAATACIQPCVRPADTFSSSKPSVFAEAQVSVFEAPSKVALSKPLLPISIAHPHLKNVPKKAQPSYFSASDESENSVTTDPSQLSKKIMAASHSGEKDHSDDASDAHDETRFVYQSKLSELNQICVPGMSVADAAHAKALAMQVMLCANAATIVQKKSIRELNEVIRQMVQQLGRGGSSLPTDAESLLSLLRTQSTHLPTFLRMRLADKDSITGHLLPLLLLALRRHSPVSPPPDPVRMYGVAV